MICPNCHQETSDGKRFCGKCGANLSATPANAVSSPAGSSTRCPACGSAVSPGVKFCGECGTAMQAEVLPRQAAKRSGVMVALLGAVVVVLAAAATWYIWGRGQQGGRSSANDLVYIPSFQGAGLFELRAVGPTQTRRVTPTAGTNDALVVYNPQRNEFYVGRSNGDDVPIIDAESFTQTGRFTDGVGWNTSGLDVSNDGTRLVVTCSDAKLLLFDTQSRALLRRTTVRGGAYPAYALFSPDDHAILVSSGNSVYEFDAATLELRKSKGLPDWQASPMALSSDGTELFSVQNGTLTSLAVPSFDIVGSIRLPEPEMPRYPVVQLSHDGTAVWVGGTQAIYNIPKSLEAYTVVKPPVAPFLMFATSKGNYRFAESSDGEYLYVLTGSEARGRLVAVEVRTSSSKMESGDIPYPSMVLVEQPSPSSAVKAP